jgi:hypothetical protein
MPLDKQNSAAFLEVIGYIKNPKIVILIAQLAKAILKKHPK